MSLINDKMTAKIKSLRLIQRFNGVDINQISHSLKIHNRIYIEKILKDKNWLHVSIPGQHLPQYIPMHSNIRCNKDIEDAEPIPET